MSAAALLGRCHELGIVLWTEGEALKYDAPRGCLDSGLRSQLVAHKAGLIAILSAPPPPPPSPREAYEARRDAFAARFGVRQIRWSGHNLGRLLRRTGERPERVAEMMTILGHLGMGDIPGYPGPGGAFDHGEMWSRRPVGPWCVVGHPYDIDAKGRELLALLGRFPTLHVGVDDVPSYYGFGTHHVRVGLIEPRRPFTKPRSTGKTRAAARAAREAFADEFGTP